MHLAHNTMNDVLKDVIGRFSIVYLNDMIVFSKDQAERYKQREKKLGYKKQLHVVQLLRKHESYADLAKCKFAQPELHFLGHIGGAQSLRVGFPNPSEICPCVGLARARGPKLLAECKGIASHFRNFILGWAIQ